MEKKPSIVKYRKKINYFNKNTPNAYNEYEYGYFHSSLTSVKRYHSVLILLMRIEGCPKNLLEWLLYNMSAGGYISNNELTRRNFISFFEKHKDSRKKAYSDDTVRIAFQALSKMGLLQQVKRSIYVANPEYFFTSDEQSRVKAIRMMLEFKNGIETKLSIDVTNGKENEFK